MSTTTSDTPRTDAILFGRLCYIRPENDMKAMYDFARELERELAEARAEITDLREQLEIERAPSGPCAPGSLS